MLHTRNEKVSAVITETETETRTETEISAETESEMSFGRSLIETKLSPCISLPTRVVKDSVTLIDNILTNYERKISAGTVVTDISDHFPVFAIFEKLSTQQLTLSEITHRSFKKENIDQLNKLINAHNWEEVFQLNYHKQMYNKFDEDFKSLLEIACPKITTKSHKNRDKLEPWMTKGLIVSRARKEKLRFKAFKNKKT